MLFSIRLSFYLELYIYLGYKHFVILCKYFSLHYGSSFNFVYIIFYIYIYFIFIVFHFLVATSMSNFL